MRPPAAFGAAAIDRPQVVGYTLSVDWTVEQTREVAKRRLEKEARRAAALEERRQAAKVFAVELAQEIGACDHSVKKVWGFGSVFDPRLRFRSSSDIDLAVEGGSLIAWKITQSAAWDVDLVDLHEQDESMVESITASGVLLYER